MENENEQQLNYAEQQITGFYECFNGGSLGDLCCSMGLTSNEFKKMNKKGMLEFLPDDLYNEIVDYLNK